MSRIGKKPIDLPKGVDLAVNGRTVTVKGKLGQLSYTLDPRVSIEVKEGTAQLTRADDARQSRALHGLARALLSNMARGVAEGFSRTLLIEGVGYRVAAKGKGLEFSLGFSHPVTVDPPEGIKFTVVKPTELKIEGADKRLVGQVAADIRKLREPEPYKGKGIRYAGETVRRKAGKAAAK